MAWLAAFVAQGGSTVNPRGAHVAAPGGTAVSAGTTRALPQPAGLGLQGPTVGRVRVPDTAQVRAPVVVSHRRQPLQQPSTPQGAATPSAFSNDLAALSDDAPAEFEASLCQRGASGCPTPASPITMRHRLRSRASVWSAFITSTLVLGWIAGGMPLLWAGDTPAPHAMSNHPSALEHAGFVRQAIRDMVATRTVMVLAKAPLVISALGVVAKKGTDKFRLIWDGRYINNHLVIPTFKYEDLHAIAQWAEPGDYAFTIDLKSGYHHLDMHEDAWPYLGFQWEGQYYCFTQLPFGLAPACWAFTKLTRSVMTVFRQRGIRCTGYIDDSMWFNKHPAALAITQADVLVNFHRLGFVVNMPKSRLEILQQAPYLGMDIDLRQGVMRVPTDKLLTIRQLLMSATQDHRRFSVRALAAIKGKLISVRWSVGHAAFFFTKAMDADISTRTSWNSHLSLSAATRAELSFWLQHFAVFDGTWPIWRTPGHDIVVHVDAAGASPSYVGGWGAVLRRPANPQYAALTAQGHWLHSQSVAASSTGLELLGVLHALHSFVHVGKLAGANVQVVTDSHNVFTHMTSGRVRAVDSVKTVQDIFLFAFRHKICISYQWVPRERNVEADALSKLQGGADEHQLHPSVFQELSREFGPFRIDLFASHTNHVLPTYFRHYTPTSAGIDAFAQPWPGVCFAHPPLAMLDRVLQYAAATLASLCFICPFWPASPWWRRICGGNGTFHSCVHAARILPDRADLLLARIGGQARDRGIRPRWPMLALRLDFGKAAVRQVRIPVALHRRAGGS
jgi:ribonuclease HI